LDRSRHGSDFELGCRWLHYGWADEVSLGIGATWHRLVPQAQEAILNLAVYGAK